jgi:hypothetical protein
MTIASRLTAEATTAVALNPDRRFRRREAGDQGRDA